MLVYVLLVAADKLINTKSQYNIDMSNFSITIALFSIFLLIIRLSLRRL